MHEQGVWRSLSRYVISSSDAHFVVVVELTHSVFIILGEDKLLHVEFSWRTPVLTIIVGEDKNIALNFESLRPVL